MSRFWALESKVLKMLMFVGVVNGHLPITTAGRAEAWAADCAGCAGGGGSVGRAQGNKALMLGLLAR